MANFDQKLQNVEPPENIGGEAPEEMHLDDARRIKVLSPGMLVFKRFIRNRLAVVGFVILLFMFMFAFVGPLFSPYDQIQVFKGIESITKDFAGAIPNQELRYTVAEGETFGGSERAGFLLAVGDGEQVFNSGENNFHYIQESEGFYRIYGLDLVAIDFAGSVNTVDGVPVSEDFDHAYHLAADNGLDSFTFDNISYRIVEGRKESQILAEREVSIALLDTFDAYNEKDTDIVSSYDFKLNSSLAIANEERLFTSKGENYSIQYDEGTSTIFDSSDNAFAEVSNIIVNPVDQSIFLPVDFKSQVRKAIVEREDNFIYTEASGDAVEYTVVRVNTNYYIKKLTATEMISMFEAPSDQHWLGTDNNGMDVITRLMYGGQVSLLVGFVVILIEVVIGVVIGGVSGFFGGWVDTALMRFVDLFNSIPFYPIVLIFGSVMDTLQVDPIYRIFLLMLVLGLLSWTGVARVVRGQILSLREQDFMVATEATGIRTSRRIFRHLIPNVMPLLIVNATAGLGGIIITEATLGFLGLGVKYPLASWGSIINVASDAFVMTNFWFMWIPAGSLILLTVLGFNFVGDGLRDAYDPRMQR